jgi:hypothetical protein
VATFLQQNDFKFGEVSPLLYARTNSPIYGNAAARLRNVFVIPQGGVRKRFGTLFSEDLTSIESNYRLYKPFFFTYEDASKYVILFTPLKITIIYNATVVATLVSTYTTTDIPLIDLAQSNNTLFITCVG